MAKSNLWTLLLVLIPAFVACTKDGNTIYQTNPDEEKPSTAPLVTVIYGPNGLGDRSYCNLIYKGVEEAAKKYGVRTLQLSPESEEQGLAYLKMMFRQMENVNARPEQFGRQRVIETVSSSIAEAYSPKELIETMTAAVRQFVGETEQSDDLTMLAIKYLCSHS